VVVGEEHPRRDAARHRRGAPSCPRLAARAFGALLDHPYPSPCLRGGIPYPLSHTTTASYPMSRATRLSFGLSLRPVGAQRSRLRDDRGQAASPRLPEQPPLAKRRVGDQGTARRPASTSRARRRRTPSVGPPRTPCWRCPHKDPLEYCDAFVSWARIAGKGVPGQGWMRRSRVRSYPALRRKG